MTSNKLFRAAILRHYGEFLWGTRPRIYSNWPILRGFSSKKASTKISSSDLLRVQRDLCSTLNQRQQQLMSRNRSQAVPAIRELEDAGEEDCISFQEEPSTSTVSKEDKKLLAIRERFRSRLNVYLQACVLTALNPNIQNQDQARRMTISYLDAADGSLRHYSKVLSSDGQAKTSVSLDDAELFNTVLFGWIQAVDSVNVDVTQKCLQLWKIMQKHNVKPNEGTLAAFYLLLKLPCAQNRKNAEYSHGEMALIVNELLGKVVCSRNFLSDPRLTESDRETLSSLLNYANLKMDFSGTISSSMSRYRRTLLKSLNEPYAAFPVEASNDAVQQNENSDNSPYVSAFENRRHLLRNFATQLQREKQGVVVVPSAFVTSEAKPTIYDQIWNEIQNYWRNSLKRRFEERKIRHTQKMENRRLFGGSDSYKVNIAPFLCLLDPEDYVDIMYDEAYKLSELRDYHGLPLKVLCTNLGKKLMARIKIELAERYGLINKIADAYEHYSEYFLNWSKYQHLNHREFWQKISTELNPLNPNLNCNNLNCKNDWLLHELGEFLYDIMIDSLKIPFSLSEAICTYRKKKNLADVKMVDAFYKAMSSHAIRKFEEIRAYKTLDTLKKKVVRREIRFDSSELPMICPPIPWHKFDEGQLLIKPVDLIRLEPSGARSLQRTKRLVPGEDVNSVLDALNILGSTPWMINQPVLNVMLQVFRGDGDMKLDIPPSLSKLPPLPQRPKGKLDSEEEVEFGKRLREVKKSNAETYSLWCTAHYRFSLAEYLKDKVLWFPHNVDFRGRTYPVPPHLNHMGDDVCRGMIMFARGRPLGPDGLKLLKIHCINLTGLKKRDSLDDRCKYADEIMQDILDSARNPLGGKRWWAKSEEPWQTLAVCVEIEKAMRMEKPEEYICHVPIHQDGSCNGLQHYAALGRDQQGAEQVNLAPADIPGDVYSAVAARIEAQRVKDAQDGRDTPTWEIARVLEGFVRRKVIKQTVMTTVYGVTRYGGRGQVGRQLKDIEDFPQDKVFRAAQYLVAKVFDSLDEIFTSARQIQDWLVDSSSLISGPKLGRTVEWVTPLGFPVSQPYFKPVHSTNACASEERLSDTSVRPFPIDYVEKPNTYKQNNAFPPNYIHSLDSTHMMLTSLHCQRRGVTFAAVHDSYWTHACTVAEMNKICREQFVALHSQPLLKNLSKFFIRRYIDSEENELRKVDSTLLAQPVKMRLAELARMRSHFESIPKLGEFNLNDILRSKYFFS